MKRLFMTKNEKTTGIKVMAFHKLSKGMRYIGKIDLCDLKPGMFLQPLYDIHSKKYLEVTGEAYKDGSSYMIPLSNGYTYLPSLVH